VHKSARTVISGNTDIIIRYIFPKSARRKLERNMIFSFFVYESKNTAAKIAILPISGGRNGYEITENGDARAKNKVLISAKSV
jgi:uncharacterized membrane protein